MNVQTWQICRGTSPCMVTGRGRGEWGRAAKGDRVPLSGKEMFYCDNYTNL